MRSFILFVSILFLASTATAYQRDKGPEVKGTAPPTQIIILDSDQADQPFTVIGRTVVCGYNTKSTLNAIRKIAKKYNADAVLGFRFAGEKTQTSYSYVYPYSVIPYATTSFLAEGFLVRWDTNGVKKIDPKGSYQIIQ